MFKEFGVCFFFQFFCVSVLITSVAAVTNQLVLHHTKQHSWRIFSLIESIMSAERVGTSGTAVEMSTKRFQ